MELPAIVVVDSAKAGDAKFSGRSLSFGCVLGAGGGGLLRARPTQPLYLRLFHVAGATEEHPLSLHLSIVRQSEIGGELLSWAGLSSLRSFNPWIPLLDLDLTKPVPVSILVQANQPIIRKGYQFYLQLASFKPDSVPWI